MGNTVSGKHLNIDLDFNANTSKAIKEIQNLQAALDKVVANATKSSVGVGAEDIKNLREASNAASELKVHLEQATNVKTGQLDLTKLNASFKSAGKNLSDYKESLSKIGATGNQAFDSLAQSILKAEVPLKKSTGLLHEFGVTLKNTARWQISSSILHGFMGSIQTAFHYAEDLNRSLNNIRIVTGQNTDQMAAFAKQANESAKALSTTTTKYTDAALIYYQQGLDDKQVKERTDVTVKMANVARESAEEVSNQMTSVWNNFNKDGSEAAESFADKMTALGAATASSTSEIAEGLSKFAGIADTIGLSFDYATSALATVTATSRESADVVGTAFKTIFARMEGLKQGKTDEDGTDLNKYSEGLAKIGVQIKDQNGALKSMDEILDDVGDRWQGLTRDQKIATAQTVAGVRQYNQLMTLMDNWDFFQKNLATTQNSEGTLQKQAEIYAESWEAARDRVTAAAQEIYSQLINDEFFVDLNDFFAGFLGTVSNVIKHLGGLKGVLAGVGALITTVFSKEMASGIDKFVSSLSFKSAKDITDQMKTEALSAFSGDKIREDTYSKLLGVQQEFMLNESKMNDFEKNLAKTYMDQNTALAEQVIQAKERAKEAEKNAAVELKTARRNVSVEKGDNYNIEQIKAIATATENAKEKFEQLRENFEEAGRSKEGLSELQKELSSLFENIDVTKLPESVRQMIEGVKLEIETLGNVSEEEVLETLNEIDGIINGNTLFENVVQRYKEDLEEMGIEGDDLTARVEKLRKALNNLANATENANIKGEQFKENTKRTGQEIEKMGNKSATLGTKITSITQSLMSVTMLINSVKGGIDIWQDDDVSTGEKILSTLSSAAMTLPMVVSGVKSLMNAFNLSKGAAIGLGATLTAVVAGVTWFFDSFTDYVNRGKKHLQEAKVAAEETKNIYEDIKTSYDSLKQSLEDYEDAKNALSKLTRGTEEWNKAVTDINNQVLELLNRFPELSKEITNIRGVLNISDKGYDIIEKGQQRIINQANQEQLFTDANVRQAEHEKWTVDKNDEMRVGINENKYNKNDSIGGTVTAAIFDTIDGITEWAGTTFFDQEDQHEEVINNTIEAYKQMGDALFEDIDTIQKHTGASEEEAKYIQQTAYTFKLRAEQEQEEHKQSLAIRQEIGRTIVENTEYAGKEYANALGVVLANKAEEIAAKDKNDYDSDEDKVAYGKGKNWEYVDTNKETGVAHFVDKEGNDKYAGKETIANGLRSTKALEEAKKELNSTAEVFDKLTGSIKDTNLKNIIGELITGETSINDYSIAQLEALKNIDFKSLNLTQEELKKIGLTDFGDLGEKIGKFADEFTDGLKDIEEEMHSDQAKQAFHSLLDDHTMQQLTQGTQKDVAAALDTAFTNKGQLGLDTVKNTFQSLTKEQLEGVVEAYKQTDWNGGVESLEQFEGALDELNIHLPIDKVNELASAFVAFGGTSVNLAQDLEQLKIAKGLSDTNDSIDPDAYAKLSEDQKEYFSLAADGNYKLITDAKTFYETVKQGTLEDFTSRMNELQVQMGTYKQATSGSHQYLSTESNANLQEKTNSQFAYLEASDYQDKSQLQQWKSDVASGTADAQTFKDIAQAVSDCGDRTEDFKTKLQSSAEEFNQLKEQAKDLMHTLDSDVDKEQWKELASYLQGAGSEIEGLSDDVKENKQECDNLSESLLRYDSALESVQNNMKNWKELLKSDDIQDQAQAVDELKNVYGDLLDIDGSQLSNEFLTNAENLELMEKAAKGSEEAYNELQEIAGKDILAQVGIDTSQFESDKEQIYNDIQSFTGQDFGSIEVGANLNDEGFLNELTNMVNSAGMTAEQATSYLASMGIDAEVETQSKQEPVKRTVNDMRPVVEDGPTVNVPVIASDGTLSFNEVSTPYIKYEPIPHEMTDINAGGGFSLKVTSANKSSGGKFKFKNTSHGAGAAGRAARKPSGGGGGKGGGKKSPRVQPRQYQDDFDLYGELNQSLQTLDNTLTKLGREYDYAFGEDRLKNLEDQNKAIREQVGYYDQLIKAKKKNLKTVDKRLKKQGVKFDEDGNISNYAKVTKKKWTAWNTARKKYEKGKISEKKWNKIDDNYQDFVKDVQYHVNNKQDIAGDKEKKAEAVRKAIENNFERWKFKLELNLDTRKAERDWRDFLKGLQFDTADFGKHYSSTLADRSAVEIEDFESQKEDLDELIEKRAELNSISTDKGYAKYAKEVKNADERIVSSAEEAKQKMKELDEKIEETAEGMKKNLDNAWANYLKGIEQAIEAFNELNDQIEHQGDLLNHAKQLLELQYGDKAYQHMEEFYNTEEKRLKTKKESLLEQQKYGKKYYDEALEAAKERAKKDGKEFDTNDPKAYTEDLRTWMSFLSDIESKLQETDLALVQNAYARAEAQIDKSWDQKEIEALGMPLEDFKDNWERIQELHDRYLSEEEKRYQIETLINKIDQSISTEKNLKNVAKLKKLREDELGLLESQEKVTQNQLDIANDHYNVLLKEMALEDARNNKNSMKLSRNQEGNWTYQYVANNDDILKKQQDYRDALHTERKRDADGQWELQKNMNEDIIKMLEEGRAIQKLGLTDQEGAQKKMSRLITHMREDLDFMYKEWDLLNLDGQIATIASLVSSFKWSPDDLKRISPQGVATAELTINLFGTEHTSITDFLTAFGYYGEQAADSFINGFIGGDPNNNNIFSQISTYAASTFIDPNDHSSVVSIVSSMVDTLKGLLTGDKNSVKSAFVDLFDFIDPNKKDSIFLQYQDVVGPIFSGIKDIIDGVNLSLDKYKLGLEAILGMDLSSLLKPVQDLYGKWKDIVGTKKKPGILDKYKDKIGSFPKSITIKVKVKYKEYNKPTNVKPSKDSDRGKDNNGNGNRPKPKPTPKPKPKPKPKKYKIVYNNNTLGSGYKSKSAAKEARKDKILALESRIQAAKAGSTGVKPLTTDERYRLTELHNSKIVAYKTGGYTGDWTQGKEDGKLAFLHQKELVLNKEDTKNILDAVNTIRDISSINNSITDAISNSIRSMFANSIKNIIGNRIPEKQNDNKIITIENINAEFPNAQDVDDIREAILSLPRLASQYVSRNLK